jgi:predicted O-methyltransferase YrrM
MNGRYIVRFLQFYLKASTRYQIHSPFVFELVNAVLEDTRYYYAFTEVERLRRQMLHSKVEIEQEDFGTGGKKQRIQRRRIAEVARKSASSPTQGRMLFRLVQHLQPKTMVELGSSLGVGTAYLASAASHARLVSLEGCAQTAAVAKSNLELLGIKNVILQTGPFEKTLEPVLSREKSVDLFFFDGNHRAEPTLRYFEACLKHATPQTLFVFDDMYWSSEMTGLWKQLQKHPKVTLTLDFFDLSLLCINPDFKEIQHFRIVPERWKPWKVF